MTQEDTNHLVAILRERACSAGEPWTGDNPEEDHGHTDCSLYHQLADEIERLRNRIAHLEQALDNLSYLKAINTITVELGPKASGPDDIADALRKAVGR